MGNEIVDGEIIEENVKEELSHENEKNTNSEVEEKKPLNSYYLVFNFAKIVGESHEVLTGSTIFNCDSPLSENILNLMINEIKRINNVSDVIILNIIKLGV